ncbi:MAG: arginine--tRNA ligase [Endomicrobium sp.]|jgi:arginyl-tRNA synthetase|nr:arginine--tRNA ligase [Endomicrobium sp.]
MELDDTIQHYIAKEFDKIVTYYLKIKGYNSQHKIHCSVVIPPKSIKYDFSINLIMGISHTLGIDPLSLSEEFFSLIVKNPRLSQIIEDITLVKPGFFINFNIQNKIVVKQIKKILNQRANYGAYPKNSREKVIIEFISANPTGPLHIGHGRGAAIGEALSRILKHLGYEVVKEYYLNDLGNQMRILEESVKFRYKQLQGKIIHAPKEYYKGQYIFTIAKRLLHKYNKMSNIVDLRTEIINDIVGSIKHDIQQLGIEFDSWFYESSLLKNANNSNNNQITEIIKHLSDKGYTYLKNDVLWLSTTQFGDDKDRVLQKIDGQYTYFALDIAYHINKLKRGFKQIINVWGADHYGYISRIKSFIKMLGLNQKIINIVLYQLVSLVKDNHIVTMSTREGEFIPLNTIINKVGANICKFFFLLRDPYSHLEFNLQLMQSNIKQNPLFYIQYAYARCSSILKASKKLDRIVLDVDVDITVLNTEIERSLIKYLIIYNDILETCKRNMSPHYLTVYLIKLADVYHKFYEMCPVLLHGKNIVLEASRLKLVECVMIIIHNVFNLLGISPMDTM